jgi:hypothetical protein
VHSSPKETPSENQPNKQILATNPHIFQDQRKEYKHGIKGAGSQMEPELTIRDQTAGMSPLGKPVE